MAGNSFKIAVSDLSCWYGSKSVLKDVDMEIYDHAITGLIGPSGCGKTSFLRTLNRLNDLVGSFRHTGSVLVDGKDIYDPDMDAMMVRRKVGMLFQQPNPFPLSIIDNIAIAVREQQPGIKRGVLMDIVVDSLERVGLWDEVKGKLRASGMSLSGGQQQRLCFARVLAVRPEVILLDEPCSSLDPISTARIEDLLIQYKDEYTFIVVTHNLGQARRISDYLGFFMNGCLVEYGEAVDLVLNPRQKETEDYLVGAFG
jgi:phosphate transport system ATP-binding protein